MRNQAFEQARLRWEEARPFGGCGVPQRQNRTCACDDAQRVKCTEWVATDGRYDRAFDATTCRSGCGAYRDGEVRFDEERVRYAAPLAPDCASQVQRRGRMCVGTRGGDADAYAADVDSGWCIVDGAETDVPPFVGVCAPRHALFLFASCAFVPWQPAMPPPPAAPDASVVLGGAAEGGGDDAPVASAPSLPPVLAITSGTDALPLIIVTFAGAGIALGTLLLLAWCIARRRLSSV